MSLTWSLVVFLCAGLVGGLLLSLIGVGMALVAVPVLNRQGRAECLHACRATPTKEEK